MTVDDIKQEVQNRANLRQHVIQLYFLSWSGRVDLKEFLRRRNDKQLLLSSKSSVLHKRACHYYLDMEYRIGLDEIRKQVKQKEQELVEQLKKEIQQLNDAITEGKMYNQELKESFVQNFISS